jgi:hypothetical protein
MGHIRQFSSEHVDRFGRLLWDAWCNMCPGLGLGDAKVRRERWHVELVGGGITDSLRAGPPII